MSKDICVITGGGSGMGLETAKIVGKFQAVVLVGRTVKKLDDAVNELNALGVEAYSYATDTSDVFAVKELVKFASSLGSVKSVVHSAGVSPTMAEAQRIFSINALGTINVDQEFLRVMGKGGCVLNVSSMAGHMLPQQNVPTGIYELALRDTLAFIESSERYINSLPQENQRGVAYMLSKNFVLWYTRQLAMTFGKKGVRISSISPGTFNTPMGVAEGEQAASFALNGPLARLGEPVEIAKMMAFMISDDCSYMTGVDVLYDGGVIASMQTRV